MSIQLVESEIRRFLATEEPEVICISGQWGVGKTFAWDRYLRDAQAQRKVKFGHYSYVSLFGVNSLDELKYSIFENIVQSSAIGIKPSLETVKSNTKAVAERIGRKAIPIISQIPIFRNYVGGVGPALFLFVNKTIICFDDIERAGKGLEIRDILGLASSLKEHKNCKVCLILNDEALEEKNQQFRTYFEKVVDTSLKFAPSAQECVDIALSAETETGRILAECCVTLGISNIRLIKKLEGYIRRILPLLNSFDEAVTRQAVQSIVLLGWSVYEPGLAPSLEYLRKRRTPSLLDMKNKESVTPEEVGWNSLMSVYGFGSMDDFDIALLEGVQNGFFDPQLIQKHGAELDRQAKATKLDSSFRDAWDLFHDSFHDNQNEVLDTMYQSFRNNVQNITPLNLQGTVQLFKELGRPQEAAELLRYYVDNRRDEPRSFDLSSYTFRGDISDPDVIAAFNSRHATLAVKPDLRSVLLSMARMKGWNPEDIELLSATTVDEFCTVFKQTQGEELRKIINSCLQFDNILNATPDTKKISATAIEALKLIGMESAINARRVKKYGIEVDIQPSAADSADGEAPSSAAAVADTR
jgi:hypothetical protein